MVLKKCLASKHDALRSLSLSSLVALLTSSSTLSASTKANMVEILMYYSFCLLILRRLKSFIKEWNKIQRRCSRGPLQRPREALCL